MNNSNAILRKIVIAFGLFALIAIVLFALTFCVREESSSLSSYTDPLVPEFADSVSAAEDEPMTEPDAISRYVVDDHRVAGGESVSFITGMYWEDMYLWPDLYVLNDFISEDPDLIYPDEIVEIYNRLGRGNEYSENETELILNAYIEVYDRFKAIGPRKNPSAWTLLWCGTKYNRDFLELYAHRIDPEDMVLVQKYIAEEGFLD